MRTRQFGAQKVRGVHMTHEEISIELFEIIPPCQVERVFGQDMVDISPEFLGFVGVYKNLAQIIPAHFTVIDFGCAYNAQSFYFMGHKRFIGVDNFPGQERFVAPMTEFFEMSISDFIDTRMDEFNIKETFAICSYVPPWGADNMKLVRDNFINVFTFYPHGGDVVVSI